MFALTINGKRFDVDVAPETPLLWVLRDTLGLIGTKFGCGAGLCGACTVHVDGMPTRSCSVPAGALAGRDIVTIEGIVEDKNHPVVVAWIEEHRRRGCAACCACDLKRNPYGDRQTHPLDTVAQSRFELDVNNTLDKVKNMMENISAGRIAPVELIAQKM